MRRKGRQHARNPVVGNRHQGRATRWKDRAKHHVSDDVGELTFRQDDPSMAAAIETQHGAAQVGAVDGEGEHPAAGRNEGLDDVGHDIVGRRVEW